jgi:signal transduction histidine kinase
MEPEIPPDQTVAQGGSEEGQSLPERPAQDPLRSCPADELQLLLEVSQRINRSLSLNEILQSLVEVATSLTEGTKSCLLEYDEQTGELVVRAAVGFRPETLAALVLAPGEGVAAEAVATGASVVVNDTREDHRVASRITDPEGIRSFIHIPIRLEDRLFGVFNISSERPYAFSERDRRLLETVANLAATAIHNARLYESLRQRTAELEAANAELEASRRQIEQSYQELQVAQAHLVQSERMATLGQLAAGLAHEIKAPLAGLQAAAEILRDRVAAVGDPHGEILQEMIQQLSRLNASLTDFLRFARPARPQRQWVNVNDVVESVCEWLQDQITQRGGTLIRQMAQEALPAWIDPDQMRQVLLNLGLNALEALPEREGQVRFCTAREEGSQAVVITVADNGHGMTPEVQRQIFYPYFTTRSGGTGLGLAMAQVIVQEHQGTIEVESEWGKGSTFRVILPAR